MINRLEEPTAGQVLVAGRDVLEQNPQELRRNIGYVFQGAGLFPHHNVARNIAAVPELLGWSKKSLRPEAEKSALSSVCRMTTMHCEFLRVVRWSAAAYRRRTGACGAPR